MYKVYVTDYTRENPQPLLFFANVSLDPAVRLFSPSLTLKKNSAGSFEFTITADNIANDYIKTITSVIEIYKDGEIFWRGRPISEERDAYDQRKIICEGSLNFLMDTVQLPMHYKGPIQSWLSYLLTTDYQDPDAPAGQLHRCHNYFFTSNDTYKRFNIKYFDTSIELDEPLDWYANYETTGDLVANVLDAYSIKMEVTYENGLTNLSFYKDYPLALRSQQVIQFGRNLISFTRSWDVEDLATVIIPIGKKIDSNETRPTYPYTPEDLDAVATIESVNQGSIMLEAGSDQIERYGRIYKKIEWNDISEPANLLDLAQHYFSEYQFDKMTMEIELFDLSVMMTGGEKAANELKLLGEVRCVSKPHGLDRYFPITEVTINLINPADTKFVLGDEDDSSSLSGAVSNVNTDLAAKIEANKVEKSQIYNEAISKAFDDATALMNQFANVGTVAFEHDPNTPSRLTGIVISNKVNWTDQDAHLWKWNLGGLAWSTDGGRTFTDAAITNDGHIRANFITVGTLNADIIRAGTISDISGNTSWNLETGVLRSKEYTVETVYPNTPDSATYVYFSTKSWDINSLYTQPPYGWSSIKVGGYDSNKWRLVVGRLFGVTETGTLAVNDGRFGGTTDTIEHRVACWRIDKDSSALGADYIHVVLNFWVMSNLYGSDVEPALNSDSTHYQVRWIYCHDLTVGESVDANVMGSDWLPLDIKQNHVNVVYDDTRQVLWNTKNFTLNDMIDPAKSGHYRVDFRTDQAIGFNRQQSYYGGDSYGVCAGWYSESVPNPEAYPLFFKQGYLRGGTNPLGDYGTFILSTRDSGEIFGVDHQGTFTICDETRSDWRLTVGANFGVTGAGVLYSNQGIFTRASVDGALNSSTFYTPYIANNGASVYIGTEDLSEQSPQTEARNVIVKVTDYFRTPQGYFAATVQAYESANRTMDSAVTLNFFLGWWEGATDDVVGTKKYPKLTLAQLQAYQPPVNGYFNKVRFTRASGTVPFTITVPKSGATVTKTFTTTINYGVIPTSPYHHQYPCALMIQQHYEDSNQYATPPDMNRPMGDSVASTYSPNATKHKAFLFSDGVGPHSDNSALLGGNSRRWKQIFAASATIITSAREFKKDIINIPENFDIFFDNLRPVSYRTKKSDSERRHSGFILDEVGTALNLAGIPSNDFAGYVTFDPKDPLADGGLRYEEFIAINTDQIQKAKKRISELEERIVLLEGIINENSSNI